MKFLVIGLGSMGKRRIRNLLANGENDIFGLDVREDRRKETEVKYNISTFDDINYVISKYKIDAFIISVPPDKHIEYINIAFLNEIHCFVEASVVDYGMKELINKLKNKRNIKICPSCTLRFHPSIKLIKSIIDQGKIGKVSNFSYHSGQYLPDWHPWEKVTEYYVGNKETGGCREIVPFELTWLNWIFGDIDKVYGIYSKTIDLEANIDDTYALTMKYNSGVIGTLLVDVVSRHAVRRLVLNGEHGQIQWDWDRKVLDVYYSFENRWVHYEEPKGSAESGYNSNIIEEMYIEEIRTFIQSVTSETCFINTLEDDYKVLQALYRAENTEGGDK